MTDDELYETLTAVCGRMIFHQMVTRDIVLNIIRTTPNPEKTFNDARTAGRRKLQRMEMDQEQDIKFADSLMDTQTKALEYLESFFADLERDLQE